ncbi:MAG TPA: hypothetical protein VF427_07215 [Noviherbaspirillum sp.]
MHTITPAFTNTRYQQQLPSHSQEPMTSDTGQIEKAPDSHTSINKNQGRGNVSRQLQKTSDSINRTSDYAVKTTVNGASSIKELLNNLAEKKKANPEMQIALVSGGSVAGYAAALKLKNCGFHVIVAEKRPAYTRQNSFILKAEAFHSLTNLSPDGKLLKSLLENKLVDIHKNTIMGEVTPSDPDGRSMAKSANTPYRFMNWLTNNDNIHSSAKIPDRIKREHETTEYLDLPQTHTKKHEPCQHLDLAWPDHEAVIPVDPQDWSYSNLGKISQDNLGLCQVRNLEKGLNQHCADQENIEIIPAEIDLKENDSEDFKYSPSFIVADNENKEHIDAPFHFDLICIAEGANSKNAAVISEQTVIPKVESWYQANFSGPESDLRGVFGVMIDKDQKQMTAIHHIGRQDGSFINMSLGIEHDKPFDPDSIESAMKHSRHMCEAAGANVEISRENMEFESQRIDVDLKRANTVMRSNAVIIGDSAGSGSPVGALGGSLALSAYPELIERLVKHPDFKKPEKRSDVELFFRKEAAPVVNIRHGIPSDTMRKLGFYSSEVNKQRIENGALALFPDIADTRRASGS